MAYIGAKYIGSTLPLLEGAAVILEVRNAVGSSTTDLELENQKPKSDKSGIWNESKTDSEGMSTTELMATSVALNGVSNRAIADTTAECDDSIRFGCQSAVAHKQGDGEESLSVTEHWSEEFQLEKPGQY